MAQAQPDARRVARGLIVVGCALAACVAPACFSGSNSSPLDNPHLLPGDDAATVTEDASAEPDATPPADATMPPMEAAPPDTDGDTVLEASLDAGPIEATPPVEAAPGSFAIGGTITGLGGTGLILELQDGSGTPLSAATLAATDTTFSFPTSIVDGGGYQVVVQAQPAGPTQVCQVGSGGSGTIMGADAVVGVSCQTTGFPVGGILSGLTGTGLVLTDNGGDRLIIPAQAGSFTFLTPVLSGAAFDVEVATQPSGPTQSCSVAGNTGTVGSGAITSVSVNCGTNTFGISGTVGNLVGSGLRLTDGTDTISVTSSTFSFPALASGSPYTIGVTQQPATPTQTCTVTTDGSGSIGGAPVSDVALGCTTNTYGVSVTVTGLSGSKTALTVDDGVDAVDLFSDGTTKLPTALASGASYTIALTQPTMPSKTCVVASGNGAGTVTSAPIAISIDCAIDTARLVATVTGLIGQQKAPLQVSDGTDSLQFAADGKMAFPTILDSGDSYAIAITNPISPNETCTVTSKNAAGTITTGGTVAIAISCSWRVNVVVWGQGGSCGAFTLTDTSGQKCSVAAATAGGEQQCPFDYTSAASFTIDSTRVLNAKTGGLCNCYQSNVDMSARLPELPFINGKDGSGGFVFASGTNTGATTLYTYCQ